MRVINAILRSLGSGFYFGYLGGFVLVVVGAFLGVAHGLFFSLLAFVSGSFPSTFATFAGVGPGLGIGALVGGLIGAFALGLAGLYFATQAQLTFTPFNAEVEFGRCLSSACTACWVSSCAGAGSGGLGMLLLKMIAGSPNRSFDLFSYGYVVGVIGGAILGLVLGAFLPGPIETASKKVKALRHRRAATEES